MLDHDKPHAEDADQTHKTHFWTILILSIVGVLVCCLAYANRTYSQRPPRIATVKEDKRPTFTNGWLTRHAVKPRPDSDELARQQAWLSNYRTVAKLDPGPPLEGADLAAVKQARELILASQPPQGFKFWPETLRAVADLGKGIRLEKIDRADARFNALMVSDVHRNRLAVRSPLDGDLSVPELAMIVIHEATHFAVHRRIKIESGINDAEDLGLRSACADWAFMATFVHEAIAFTNHQLWAKDNMSPTDVVSRAALPYNTVDGSSDSPELRRSFVKFLLERTKDQVGRFIRESASTVNASGADSVDCGPPIVARGVRRGEYFLPSDISPDVALKYMNH